MKPDGSSRIKKVDPELVPLRIVLTYEEVAFSINRSKRYVEELVATKQLGTVEPGRVSRNQLNLYIERLEIRALHEQEAIRFGKPRRHRSK